MDQSLSDLEIICERPRYAAMLTDAGDHLRARTRVDCVECFDDVPITAHNLIRVLLLDARGGAIEDRIQAADADSVLVMGTECCHETAARALRAGAGGFVLETAAPVEIATAVRAVAVGATYVCPDLLEGLEVRLAALLDHGHGPLQVEELTDRELDVMQLMSLGDTNAQIADRLFVSVSTVRTHVLSIYRKLGVDNRTQATAVFLARTDAHPLSTA